MASNKVFHLGEVIKSSKSEPFLKCDLCNSHNIREDSSGYICKECGCVLEIQKFEYHRPYDDDIIQYAVLGKTQIGSKRERRQYTNAITLEKLNRIHSINSNEENLKINAKIEIRRILGALHRPKSLESIIFEKYHAIRAKISPRTKYRSPEKLVPIVIFYYHKLNNMPIDEKKLLELAKISKKDFSDFKLQINEFIPHYAERNRKEYILQEIGKLTDHFELGMEFYYQAKRILYKLWDVIKNTKDSVIAGVVSSILILCNDQVDVKISYICERLGIRMSTIQSQVKKHIFKRLNVSGFKSLVRSSDLLREIMEQMELVEYSSKNQNKNQEQEQIELIEINLGTSRQIFNPNNSFSYYIYAIHLNDGYLVISPEDIDYRYLTNSLTEIKNNEKLYDSSKINLELWKYHMKGPPSCSRYSLSSE